MKLTVLFLRKLKLIEIKTNYSIILYLFFSLIAKNLKAEGVLPVIKSEKFISLTIDKEINSSQNCGCENSPLFKHFLHAQLNFNTGSNKYSHLSRGLQTIVKAAVETVYPELMLIHQKKLTVYLSKFHSSNLLAKIPIEVDVNLKIS